MMGMVFSNAAVCNFIVLATGSTLFTAGNNYIQTAADAAKALDGLPAMPQVCCSPSA